MHPYKGGDQLREVSTLKRSPFERGIQLKEVSFSEGAEWASLPDGLLYFARLIGGSVRRNDVRCRLVVRIGRERNTAIRTKYQKWPGSGQANL